MQNMKQASWVLSLVFFFFFRSVTAAHALEEHEKLWLGFSVDRPISQDEKWRALFFTQMRFIDKSHPWQMSLFESGIGRIVFPKNTLWFGYRWSAHNPNNNFYQINMLWQQWIVEMRDASEAKILLRSRFEEILRGNKSPVALRLRERFYYLLPFTFHQFITPAFYDEVFFQFNNTAFTAHHFISENRLFIGVNLLASPTSFWEVGYINQYLFATPINRTNEMNHVLSVNYILV